MARYLKRRHHMPPAEAEDERSERVQHDPDEEQATDEMLQWPDYSEAQLEEDA